MIVCHCVAVGGCAYQELALGALAQSPAGSLKAVSALHTVGHAQQARPALTVFSITILSEALAAVAELQVAARARSAAVVADGAMAQRAANGAGSAERRAAVTVAAHHSAACILVTLVG